MRLLVDGLAACFALAICAVFLVAALWVQTSILVWLAKLVWPELDIRVTPGTMATVAVVHVGAFLLFARGLRVLTALAAEKNE